MFGMREVGGGEDQFCGRVVGVRPANSGGTSASITASPSSDEPGRSGVETAYPEQFMAANGFAKEFVVAAGGPAPAGQKLLDDAPAGAS
jgi:hypothetical protein